MKIRRDKAFWASVLFTVSFLLVSKGPIVNLGSGRNTENLNAAWTWVARDEHQIAVLTLIILLIGIIVTWTGYLRGLRWSWSIMFIIVWLWAFPLLMLPIVQSIQRNGFRVLVEVAQGPVGRIGLMGGVVFLLMLTALILPMKSFFSARKGMARAST